MLCEVCNEEEAAFSIIPTGEGMPQILGPACFARAGLELAKQILPAEEIADTLGPMFVQPARPAAEPKAGKSKAKVKPAETAEPVQATGTDGGAAEVPAPDQDA